MIAHKRIRAVDRKVEAVPIKQGVYSTHTRQNGWTDIRIIEMPQDCIIDSEYKYHRGETVPGIYESHFSKQEGDFLLFNGSFVSGTGQILGRTLADGFVIAPDIEGKTEQRKHLYYDNDQMGIERVNDRSKKWAVQGSPTLRWEGKDVAQESIEAENTPPDIADSNAPRTAGGFKPNGNLVMLFVDGRGSIDAGLTVQALEAVFEWLGCDYAINLDGGHSSTLVASNTAIQSRLGMVTTKHICDTRYTQPRKVHHAIALKIDVEKLLKGGKDDMSKPILIMDPGHGGKDPGGGSNQHWKEKDMVLNISLYQYDRFKQLGVSVATTRTDDTTLEPINRTNMVKQSGAKYCLSNHINAAVASARGAETIHSIYSDGKLAHALYNAIVEEGMPGRRVFNRKGANDQDYYFMHRETGAVETIIIEYGFATNPKDAELIEANWKRYAESVVRAYCQFIDHPYAPPKKEVVNVEGQFKDVPPNHWAAASIKKAAESGVLVGVSKDKFGVGETVTREQLAVILDRVGLLEKGGK